jgi:branched-chain amino acid transport system permease protein
MESAASQLSSPGAGALQSAVVGRSAWRPVLRMGLIGLVVTVYLCLVGIVGTFSSRPIVAGVISLGQTSLLLALVGSGYMGVRAAPGTGGVRIAAGALTGFMAGLGPAALVLLRQVVDYRGFAVQATPDLFNVLTLGLGTAGFWIMPAVGLLLGASTAIASTLRPDLRRPLVWALASLVVVGLFSPLIRVPVANSPLAALGESLFALQGLTVAGAIFTTVLVVGGEEFIHGLQPRRRIAELPAGRRQALAGPGLVAALLVVAWLPLGLTSFFAQVVALVAIYILMGFGLNITLGLAGLLDLGFVAFFAVGAYTVGLLTSTGEFGLAHWSFWAAVPVAVLVAMGFGAFFGLPILGIRGDYLAIATLGFGEIVRILAGSNLLLPWLGGPQGILDINKPIPVPPNNPLAGPNQIYYIALICAAIVAFVSIRLRDSRLGRAWMAIREDEDVAEALGVNLVQTKLLAYMMGAAFAGLGGAIFAGLIGSIFASSMQLYVSINVASLIIVGGMGSVPGVVYGAIFLIGLPEAFREFAEFRYLFYGFALIAMMLYRPEGLVPSRITRRELPRQPTKRLSPPARHRQPSGRGRWHLSWRPRASPSASAGSWPSTTSTSRSSAEQSRR